MNYKTKLAGRSRNFKVIAGAAGVGICLAVAGFSGTVSLWRDNDEIDTATEITTGTLAVNQPHPGVWTDSKGNVLELGDAAHVVPGQTYTYRTTVVPDITGDVEAMLDVPPPSGMGYGYLYLSRTLSIDGEAIDNGTVFSAADSGTPVDVEVTATLDPNVPQEIVSGQGMWVDDLTVTLKQVLGGALELTDNYGQTYLVWPGGQPSADLAHADFSGQELSGLDLTGASLYYTSLQGADLTGTVFEGAHLGGADLSGATIDGRIITLADLDDMGATYDKWTTVGPTVTVTGIGWNTSTVAQSPGWSWPMVVRDTVTASYLTRDGGHDAQVDLRALAMADQWEDIGWIWSLLDGSGEYELRAVLDGSETAAGLTPSDRDGALTWTIPTDPDETSFAYQLEVIALDTDQVLEIWDLTMTLAAQ